MKGDNLVCLCMEVSEKEITSNIKNGSCKDTSDVQNITYAGTNCGKCLPIIDQLVEENSSRNK